MQLTLTQEDLDNALQCDNCLVEVAAIRILGNKYSRAGWTRLTVGSITYQIPEEAVPYITAFDHLIAKRTTSLGLPLPFTFEASIKRIWHLA